MKKKIIGGFLAITLGLQTSGCGTLMFQERHGQEPGRLDANVMILDGIGLFFFIIPGLVAYAIDFTTGSIYLPADVKSGQGPFIWDAKTTEVEDVPAVEATEPEAAPAVEATEPE